MASSESDFSDVEVDKGEGVAHDGLPTGSEREIIEYYFNRDFTYRDVTLILGKHQHIDINERTLKRRLNDYGLRRRDVVNDDLVERVRDLIKPEICTGPSTGSHVDIA